MCSSNKTFQERFHRLSLKDGGGIDYDCEFVVGPQNMVVEGHKFMFAAASEVFKAMFYGDLKEEKPVKVEDLDPEGFKGMKQFIYLGEVNFTSAIHALLTYASARKYMVPGLGEECIKYVEEKLQPSEVLEFYEYCKVSCISEFDDVCSKIIQEKTDEVVESEYFVSCKVEAIELLLKSPSLKLESESKLFVHFERWALAESDRKNISAKLMQSSFNNLKKHIRFLTMSMKEFVFCVLKSLLLTQDEKNTIIQNLTDANSEPMPESLSVEQQYRNFNISSVTPKNYQYDRFFTVLIGTRCTSRECIVAQYYTGKSKIISIHVTCIETFSKYICFHLHCSMVKSLNGLNFLEQILNIESRLRVVAEDSRDNDLYFWNKHHFVLQWSSDWGEKLNVTFAKIPIDKLKNRKLIRGTSNTVIIEASFNFDVENFENAPRSLNYEFKKY